MAKLLSDLAPTPARSILPPLSVMEILGYSQERCLAGTGFSRDQLAVSGARISLEQELCFYRNILDLTGNPAIGLELGTPFLLQHYGLFGYAVLSAESFRHALTIAENFGRLSFSFFNFSFGVEGGSAWFRLADPPPLEPGLLRLFADRDISAARANFSAALGRPLVLDQVTLPHDGRPDPTAYHSHFDCPAAFGSTHASLHFSTEIMDRPLPQSDPETSRHLQQQCQLLVAKLSAQGNFVDEVRLLVLARPGFFPDIDFVAERMGMSTRTLRRRLGEEGSSYRGILDEVRYGLAREYLLNTDLPMDEVSRLLGYSESGNFSHAFRRWSGESPSGWRRQQRAC